MFTHYVMHDATVLAWSSCRCLATRNHYVGQEVLPPSPIGVRMSDIQNKRAALRDLYGDAWKAKVDKMPEKQVIALYFKFKEEGKIK